MGTNPSARKFLSIVVSLSLLSILIALSGCTYIEAQLQRRAPPDTRVKLGWQDRISVYARDVDEYTCVRQYILRCDGGGAITMSCTCVQL